MNELTKEEQIKADEDYLSAMRLMFKTDGWQFFMEDISRFLETEKAGLLHSADGSDSRNNIWAYRARVDLYERLLSWEENTEAAAELAENPEKSELVSMEEVIHQINESEDEEEEYLF